MLLYPTQSNQIKGLNKTEYEVLREMCRYSNNLYNIALLSIRQYFFAEKKLLRDASNYHVVKNHRNDVAGQAGAAQQILKVVAQVFCSFFPLFKKAKKGAYRLLDREIPDLGRIKIPFPVRLDGKVVKTVRILSLELARFFQAQSVYAAASERHAIAEDTALTIDLNVQESATYKNRTNGSSLLVNGKPLKSISRQYSGRSARLPQPDDPQPPRPRLQEEGCALPHRRLPGEPHRGRHRAILKAGPPSRTAQPPVLHDNVCERCGIHDMQARFCTSQASFLHLDEMPGWDRIHQRLAVGGKRIQPGLYQSAGGFRVHAHANGAANSSLRKSGHRLPVERVARRLWANPLRVNLTPRSAS